MRSILIVLVFAGIAHAQAPPPPPPVAKGEKILYLVRYGVAKDLSATLSQHFGPDSGMQFIAEPNANALLITAPTAQTGELVKLLDQLDRRPRQVVIDVMLVDVTLDEKETAIDPKDFTGTPETVFAKADGLMKRGKAGQIRRFRIAGLENQTASTTLGGSQPFVTGMTPNRFGGAGAQATATISYRDVGTTLTATPRVTADAITVEMRLNDSRMQPSESTVPVGPDTKATEMTNTLFNGKVRIPSGEAVLAERVHTESKAQKVQTLVIVSAKLVEK